uniref:Uncharacterized protein n=1 Tax=Setaria viridis TaxID=4556 RepID=A0A4U6U604_SETVI|nr:hypothetical protein SEVIR_6G129200v2 [Setaria viridis]
MRNGKWSDDASNVVYSTYKQSTGCKTSAVHGHGYMSTRPTERESMKAQLEEQARATDAANQQNQDLEDEIEKLNEKLANQEAKSERKFEEKLQQFKEEESKKILALRDKFMAALQGCRRNPVSSNYPKSSDISGEATPPVEKMEKIASKTPSSKAT